MRTVIKWNRIGKDYRAEDLDVTAHIDLEGLEQAVLHHVRNLVPPPVSIRLEIHLDGGEFSNLAYGDGRIQADLPKAADHG